MRLRRPSTQSWAHDDERLSVLAPNTGDRYHWTCDYGTHRTVDLVIPHATAHAAGSPHADSAARHDAPVANERRDPRA